jgi:hypothetical protein
MRPTLLSGLDLLSVRLPDDTAVLRPPQTGAHIDNVGAAVGRALHDSPPRAVVGSSGKVVVVLDDPTRSPVPAAPHWAQVVEAVVASLRDPAHPQRPIQLYVACGLNRRPRLAEVQALLGSKLAALPLQVHDAELPRDFTAVEGQGVRVDLPRALADADGLVWVSLRQMAPQKPLEGLLEGLATWRTLSPLYAPGVGPAGRATGAAARLQLLREKLPRLFAVVGVLGPELVAGPYQTVLEGQGGLGRAERTWNRLPTRVRRRLASTWRSAAPLCEVHAGPADEAVARAEASLARRWALGPGLAAPGSLEALIIPVPDLSPYAPGAKTNPVLALHMGLCTQLGPVRSLLGPKARVLLLHPLRESFDLELHPGYVEFHQRLLRQQQKADDLLAKHEREFCGRPEFVASYEQRGGVHGAHVFYRWKEIEEARAGLGGVWGVGSGAAAAQRLSVDPVDNLDAALDRLTRELGHAPRLGLLGLPSPFAA